MKTSKKVIYLSLNDLKELGIIKKKKRRGYKNKNKSLYKNESGGVRSISNHMIGSQQSGTPVQFSNTSNLQSDNLRLNNLLLENKLKDEPSQNQTVIPFDNNQIDTLQKAVDKQQNNYYYVTGLMEQNRFNQPTHTSPFNSAFVDTNIAKNNDVPFTFGSDYFKSQERQNNDNNDLSYNFDSIYKSPDSVQNNDDDNDIDQNELPVKGPPYPDQNELPVKESSYIEEVNENKSSSVKERIKELNQITNNDNKKDNENDRQNLRTQLQNYGLEFDSIKNNQTAMKQLLNKHKKEITISIGEYTDLCREKNEKIKPSVIKSTDLAQIKRAIKKLKNK
jgi:hypothetical protein